ncbi:hypothetical protein, partial [Mesorhizobium sp.]|uniref:hypothetical protein n=1 Tax=Mesorhizobium sp. TaxID=1871066 RepID=UPI0025BC08BF
FGNLLAGAGFTAGFGGTAFVGTAFAAGFAAAGFFAADLAGTGLAAAGVFVATGAFVEAGLAAFPGAALAGDLAVSFTGVAAFDLAAALAAGAVLPDPAAGFDAAFVLAGAVVFAAFATLSLPSSFTRAAPPLNDRSVLRRNGCGFLKKSSVPSMYCDYPWPCKSCPCGRSPKICRRNPSVLPRPERSFPNSGPREGSRAAPISRRRRSIKKCDR